MSQEVVVEQEGFELPPLRCNGRAIGPGGRGQHKDTLIQELFSSYRG